jgi:hypothetical protein
MTYYNKENMTGKMIALFIFAVYVHHLRSFTKIL